MAFQGKTKEFDHKLLEVRRTARVVAGGRRFSFRAAVAAGNRHERVGVGIGKGPDVQSAVNRAISQALASLISVHLKKETIAHATEAKFSAARVLLRPAAAGRGIVAGGAVRAVCDLAGIPNITAKVLSRTGNKISIARATIKALAQLKSEARTDRDPNLRTPQSPALLLPRQNELVSPRDPNDPNH